ncbi:Oidioi.mRNA.OKI2018_I69.PAR.g10080.t1.cds [Oikopleura dioica]|uniref:Oidioi.mRNA.OKI2018_I69.PAR.g10080.t1.cds n=1 Tax=Oikopleura dioica TaxID=34765 RepID=A0ABN7RNT3_OIKDI|nr:Oidioi.mRNA.OKI2018_I69.PAR.g10080.t1.cds [Oikopleura dioica]
MIMAPQLMLANSAHMPGMAGAPNPFGQPDIWWHAKQIRWNAWTIQSFFSTEPIFCNGHAMQLLTILQQLLLIPVSISSLLTALATKTKGFPHFVTECVPIDMEEAEMGPMYFQKAFQDAEDMWAINEAVINTMKEMSHFKKVQKLGHIAVEFGGGGGFAHIVENNERVPPYFMREILGGLADISPRKWRKPALDEEAEVIFRAEQMEKSLKENRYPPLERAAEISQPSPHFISPKKTSNKSSNSKLVSDLDPDQPTPSPQRKTSSAKESTEISPRIPLAELLQSQKSPDGWGTQETQLSQLSRYEMMERAAEFSQSTTDATPDKNRTEHSPKTPRAEKKQNKAVKPSPKVSENTLGSEEGIAGISVSVSGELLNDEVPSDPEISLSVSGELFDDELQPIDTTQISQQDEEEANSSQGSSVYKTPEKSLPKTPSKTDQSAPASPPQPPRKLRRSLFNENQEEPMDTPEIIMASSGDTTGKSKRSKQKIPGHRFLERRYERLKGEQEGLTMCRTYAPKSLKKKSRKKR